MDLNNPKPIKLISDVCVGDSIAVKNTIRNSWSGARVTPYLVLVVDRLTAKQFVTKTGRRFNRETGREIGANAYNMPAVVVGYDYCVAMKELAVDIEQEKALRFWATTVGDRARVLPVGALRAMRDAYDNWKAAQPKPEGEQ